MAFTYLKFKSVKCLCLLSEVPVYGHGLGLDYRQDAAKRQTAGIKFTHSQITGFSPIRGD